jgi:RimJ/RimL family protein N-acetyltransferase
VSVTIGNAPDRPSVHPVALNGARVALREFQAADAHAAYEWASDPAFFRYMASEPVVSIAEEALFIRDVQKYARVRPRVHYTLGIVEQDTDALIGIARLSVIDPTQRGADMGYGIRTDCRGRGIATEAAGMLVDFGFSTLGLHRIWALCDPQNVGSRRVMEKVGMRCEGRHREHVFAHGEWRDSLVFAVLEDEWRVAGGRKIEQ